MESFAERIISLFQTIHPLDRVPRAGFTLRGVPEPESVSAHSHFVSLMALLFVEQSPGEYDKGKVLAMALIHDLSESKIMDIPMPYADAYLKDAKHNAEQTIIEEMLDPFSINLAQLHAEFAEAKTPEARLLRGLDKAQMMIKILCYQREHKGWLEEFWENPKNFAAHGIAEVDALFDAICLHAGRPRPR